MDPDKIPLELRQRRQWVSFKFQSQSNGSSNGKPLKLPFNPVTGKRASSTDPKSWVTFEEALAGGNPAYALTKEDGIGFLDLDETIDEKLADQILDTFDTYTEVSSSGRGLHLIFRGRMESERGLHRQGVEMYSHSRFCIFTGDVFEARGEIKSVDQEWLGKLEAEMQARGIRIVDLEELPQLLEDETVLVNCSDHFVRFKDLWKGNYQKFAEYPSQSEADHAIIGMLCCESLCNNQVQRLFEKSGLYRPNKPHKFRYSLIRIRSEQQAQEEADEFTRQMLADRVIQIAEEKLPDSVASILKPVNDPELFTTIPKGLILDLFNAYQAWAHYPLKEGSLLAAMITALALFQRKYQTPTRAALNMWLFLVGPSSAGKEIVSKGPLAIFRESKAAMPKVFGGELRSSPGLEDALRGSLRHVAYHAECNTWLKPLCDPRENSHWQQLRTKLMETFTKGADVMLVRQTKVQKGDTKEYELVRPCLTIFGDCVTQRFYEAVGTSQIGDGFLPRISVLEVDHDSISVERNKRTEFPAHLLDEINKLAHQALMADMATEGEEVPIRLDAEQLYDEFCRAIRKKLKDEPNHPENDLRGKLGEKVIKIATLLGICRSPIRPEIHREDVEWAMLFVKNTDGRMAAKLASGEHDPAIHQQTKNVQLRLDRARLMGPEARAKNRNFTKNPHMLSQPDLIPWAWLRDEAGKMACFRQDRRGVPIALSGVLKDLEASGDVTIITKEQAIKNFGFHGVVVINMRTPYSGEDIF